MNILSRTILQESKCIQVDVCSITNFKISQAGLSLTILDYHGKSRTIPDYHGLSQTIMDYHRLSLTITVYHRVSRTIPDYHGLSRTIANKSLQLTDAEDCKIDSVICIQHLQVQALKYILHPNFSFVNRQKI